MDKILNIFARGPVSMSGFNAPHRGSYKLFLRNSYDKSLSFGSMSIDRKNYSMDIKSVFKDYRSASKEYLQER